MKKITASILGYALICAPLITYAVTPAASYKGELPAPPAKESIGALTGNFDITTNYMFRGISQSNNLPAFQGGLTYTFKKPGIYFNLWGSNVYQSETTRDGTTIGTATVEIDTIVGVANSIGDKFSYDISIGRYNYPKADRLAYDELNIVANYSFLTGKIGYAPNVWDSHQTGIYYNAGVNFDIPCKYVFNLNDVSINAAVGHYNLPSSAGKSYNDYSFQINKQISNYKLSLQWTDTNHPLTNSTLDDSKILATVLVDF